MTLPTNDATLLVITPLSGREGMMLPPYAARGLTQTLAQIDGSGTPRRTINAELLDVTHPPFRKYKSVITCTDVDTPAFDGAWKGLKVQVDFTIELSFLTGSTQQRAEVSGSHHIEGHFEYYRPSLIMMVMNFSNSFAEWQAANAWQIELAEV